MLASLGLFVSQFSANGDKVRWDNTQKMDTNLLVCINYMNQCFNEYFLLTEQASVRNSTQYCSMQGIFTNFSGIA